jgi:virulence-associated protein VagC
MTILPEVEMITVDARVIQDGDEQIVLLPDEIAFPAGAEVVMLRVGDEIRITPAQPSAEAALRRLEDHQAPDIAS